MVRDRPSPKTGPVPHRMGSARSGRCACPRWDNQLFSCQRPPAPVGAWLPPLRLPGRAPGEPKTLKRRKPGSLSGARLRCPETGLKVRRRAPPWDRRRYRSPPECGRTSPRIHHTQALRRLGVLRPAAFCLDAGGEWTSKSGSLRPSGLPTATHTVNQVVPAVNYFLLDGVRRIYFRFWGQLPDPNQK